MKLTAHYVEAANDWFSNWSREEQENYIKDHPNSKYAKGTKPSGEKPSVKQEKGIKVNPKGKAKVVNVEAH